MSDLLLDILPKTKITKPSLWVVIFHNDDKTTVDFVIKVLRTIFHKNEQEAEELTYMVHNNGFAKVAIYPFDVAQTKADATISLARSENFPLNVSIEKN